MGKKKPSSPFESMLAPGFQTIDERCSELIEEGWDQEAARVRAAMETRDPEDGEMRVNMQTDEIEGWDEAEWFWRVLSSGGT